MKKRTKIILIVIASIVLLGTMLGTIDYKRIKSGKMPLFMIRITDGSKSNHHYIGLGYRLDRVIGVSHKQPLYSDNEVKFGLWIYTWKINVKVPSNNGDNKIEYSIKSNYDFKNAKEDGLVVYHNGGIVDNVNKVNEFYNDSKNNIKSFVTIIHYTIEGDPIVYQYHYQDGKYILFMDTTRDKFGQQEITKKEITAIEIIKNSYNQDFLQAKELTSENSISCNTSDFEMSLYTDKKEYKTTEKIEMWVTLKYVGNKDKITIYHAGSAESDTYIYYSITDGKNFNVDSVSNMMGKSTILNKNKLYHFDYQKSGSWDPAGPDADFWEKFYKEKNLLLPKGEYTITAKGGFSLSSNANQNIDLICKLKIKVVE